MDNKAAMCCTVDQVYIMNDNYAQIDSVFGDNVPLCAVNQKKLWCEYTCSPRQSDFVAAIGYLEKEGQEYT